MITILVKDIKDLKLANKDIKTAPMDFSIRAFWVVINSSLLKEPQTHADITQTINYFCLGDNCPGKRIMPFRHNR